MRLYARFSAISHNIVICSQITIMLCCLATVTGCKTTKDAATASAEMTSTAKSLSDYYAALGVILDDTDKIHTLNNQLYEKPYSLDNQKGLKDTEDELAKRVTLASDLSTMADSFAKLTGSTAPDDVVKSASKLETDVDSLASHTSSTIEQNAIKNALQIFIVAIQAHHEREAAQALDKLASDMSNFFNKETHDWDSVATVYYGLAATLAKNLVDDKAVDSSALLAPALSPFGLTPLLSENIREKLKSTTKLQIDVQKEAKLKSYHDTTQAMSQALHEMSERIHLVATDKPLAFYAPPITVTNVEQWASKILLSE